ncbi:MAG: amino acid adenylation domain-containing protein, partial [bacterium]|nr:amino acid adenylation domain-containing protein [bacterium]
AIKMVNAYGPTEASDDITHHIMAQAPHAPQVPIGKTLHNLAIYIVDKHMNLCPSGIKGEICVAGIGVGRGYLNNPELTAGKFIPNPFVEAVARTQYPITNNELYRTGDLGTWTQDGVVEFFGRIDFQVKIRGFRIELGDIENALVKHRQVEQSVVLAIEDSAGNYFLAAYYTGTAPEEALRDFLSEKLPDYMIPSTFIPLEELPLTPNGKIDRKALPEPGETTTASYQYQPPTNQTEEKLVEIWRDVLGLKQIGVTDNFFEIGGHSLKAINIIAQINKTFQVDLPLIVLFEKPFIKDQARYIIHSGTTTFTAVEAVEKKDYYPVSAAQKRLYALNRFTPDSVNYNMPDAMIIEGELSIVDFEEAFQKLIQRHETLRTSFHFVDDEPVQRIHEPTEIVFEVEQTTGTTFSRFLRPFELDRAPLLRVELVKQEENRHIFLFDMHHIISDGVSLGILVKEFGALYARQELEPLTLQYKEYATWQNRFMESEKLLQQKTYWLEKFSGEIPVLAMPTDYPRPAVQDFEGETITFEIEAEQVEGIRRLTQNHGTTLYMVLLALFNIQMSKYGGQEDIIVGTPSAGRRHTDLDNIIGMFINTLAMRNKPAAAKSFEEFLTEVKQNSLEAFENQDYQFDHLLDHLNLKRDLGRNPLFDAMFILQNFRNEELEIKNLTLKPYEFEDKVSKLDITLQVTEGENKLYAHLEYCVGLFKKETMERFFKHYINIMADAVTNPGKALAKINMLSQAEEKQLLYQFNSTQTEYPSEKTIHQLFEEQAARTPNKISTIGATCIPSTKSTPSTASIPSTQSGTRHPASGPQSLQSFPSFSSTQLTHRELDKKSNQLATRLREKGGEREMFVGIMLERSVEMLIGILAVLKAGGAYLPIDPQYPATRIQFMLEDSSTALLLTTPSTAKEIHFQKEIVNIEEQLNDKLDHESDGRGEPSTSTRNPSSSLAYVIYTSGSTGKPKGVLISHRAVNNFILGVCGRIEFSPAKTLLSATTFSFDIFVLETLLPLTKGLRIIFPGSYRQKIPRLLLELILKHDVKMLQSTPTLMSALLESEEGTGGFKNLTDIMVGGEAVPSTLLASLREKAGSQTRIFNMYGPTETTVWSTIRELTRDTEITIGTPIANTQIYIIGTTNTIQPIGVHGELCIAGDGMARGYLNRQELTAEKFVKENYKLQATKKEKEQRAKEPEKGSQSQQKRTALQIKAFGSPEPFSRKGFWPAESPRR